MSDQKRSRDNNNTPPVTKAQKIVEVVPEKPDYVATPADIQSLEAFLKLYDYNVTNLYVNKVAYNNLKEPFTDLNKMIGMTKLKHDLLIMALYYMKNVPEKFTELMEKKHGDDAEKKEPTKRKTLFVIPDEDSFLDEEEDEEDLGFNDDLDEEDEDMMDAADEDNEEDAEYYRRIEEDEMDPEDEQRMKDYVRLLTLAILTSGGPTLPPPPNVDTPVEPVVEEAPPTPKFARSKKGRADKAKYEKEKEEKKAADELAEQERVAQIAARKAEREAKIAEATRIAKENEDHAMLQKIEDDEVIKDTLATLDMLHTVICGVPGTGKTHVAKYIGQIYAAFGFLKKGKFNKVGGVDLIGGFVGQTAIKTKKVCDDALGGVLFLDEAYSLGSAEGRGFDEYGMESAATFTDYLTEHKHDFVMIVAGYEDKLNEQFFTLNSGLQRRFQWTFKTEKYSPLQLKKIFLKMANEHRLTFIEEPSVSWFQKRYENFKHFGGSMETLISKVKYMHVPRSMFLPQEHHNKINMIDMNLGYLKYKEHVDAMTDEGPPPHMYI
jgi:hypothetical protein